MNDLNSVLVEGNLTRDPMLGATPRGTPVCNFGVALNRYYRIDGEMQEEVSYFDVETWSKLAERCGDELKKGRNVRVVGRLRQDRWTDKEGNPRSKVKIVAEHVDFGRKPKAQIELETEELESEAEEAIEEKEPVPVF
ncbi:MAG: single-stranded DNA-binding protein [Spirochaetota bacterium]